MFWQFSVLINRKHLLSRFCFLKFSENLMMMPSAPHLSSCWWGWPSWWAEPMTEAGSVSSGCPDWRTWGREWQRSPGQRTASSSTTWLDGQWLGGRRRTKGVLLSCQSNAQPAMSAYLDCVICCHLDILFRSVISSLSFFFMKPELSVLCTTLLSDW